MDYEFRFFRRNYVNQQFWYSHDDTQAGLAGAGNNVNDYNISGYTPSSLSILTIHGRAEKEV